MSSLLVPLRVFLLILLLFGINTYILRFCTTLVFKSKVLGKTIESSTFGTTF